MSSPPLRSYRTLPAINARLAVLYAKANRIVAYNETLDPSRLDEKQLASMLADRRCPVPGVDRFPTPMWSQLRRTIDFLESRRRRLERDRHLRRSLVGIGRRVASAFSSAYDALRPATEPDFFDDSETRP